MLQLDIPPPPQGQQSQSQRGPPLARPSLIRHASSSSLDELSPNSHHSQSARQRVLPPINNNNSPSPSPRPPGSPIPSGASPRPRMSRGGPPRTNTPGSPRHHHNSVLGPPFLPQEEGGRRHGVYDDTTQHSAVALVSSHLQQMNDHEHQSREVQKAKVREGDKTLKAVSVALQAEQLKRDAERQAHARDTNANRLLADRKQKHEERDKVSIIISHPFFLVLNSIHVHL